MQEPILISTQDAITIITLNRPQKRNAMNDEMVQALSHLLKKLAMDESVRVLILCGAGEHFCAGADLASMKDIGNSSDENNYQNAKIFADFMYQLHSFPKPTIALTHGIALGGGLGLLSACDIAIATKGSYFIFSEAKIGLAASTISPYVIAAIGERAARYYFLTGERFDAFEAKRIQLIHQIVEEESLLSTGMMLAKTLLLNGPAALIAAKKLIRDVSKEKITEALVQKTAEHLAHIRSSKEAQEGLSAFLEKRNPKW